MYAHPHLCPPHPHLSPLLHVCAPSERLQGCMLAVTHQLCPLARTGPGQGSEPGPSCQRHHIQKKNTHPHHHLPDENKLWRGSVLEWGYIWNTISYIHSAATHTAAWSVNLLCGFSGPIFGQHKAASFTARSLSRHKHTHSHMHPLPFKGMTALSFRTQETTYSKKQACWQLHTHKVAYSHAAVCQQKEKRKLRRKEKDALPFLPLVLHPTLFSFPSRVHTVSEEGIHSWEERRRRRRKRSWRVRERRREGGREGGASRMRAGGEGGGGQLVRVDGRGVRFRAAAAHPEAKEIEGDII